MPSSVRIWKLSTQSFWNSYFRKISVDEDYEDSCID